MASSTLSTFAAVGSSIPEWLRYVIVFGFISIAFFALIWALFYGSHVEDEPEQIQNGSGDWLWRPEDR